MKKLLLSIAFLLFLTSCTGTAKTVTPNFSLNSEVSATYMNTEYVFSAVSDENGRLTMKIKKPENLSGLVITGSAEGITASCGDVKTDCKNGYIPFTQLYKILSFAKSSQPVSVTETGESYTAEYVQENRKYIFLTDSQGNIKQISTPTGKYELR